MRESVVLGKAPRGLAKASLGRAVLLLPLLTTLSACTQLHGSAGHSFESLGELRCEGPEQSASNSGSLLEEIDLDWDRAKSSAEGLNEELERILACALGDVGGSGHEDHLRLFRAHLVVVLLARYSAFVVTGEVGDLYAVDYEIRENTVRHAALILTRIERASQLLREASRVVSSQDAPTSPTPTVDRLERTIAVLQIALEVAPVTVDRVRSRTRGLFTTTIAGATTRDLEDAVNEAVEGLKVSATLHFFGSAYLQDMRAHLARLAASEQPPTAEDWAAWDVPLDDACTRLASLVSGQADCVPATN